MRSYRHTFSAALRCGLIEARYRRDGVTPATVFSAALRCGLIEATSIQHRPWIHSARFPQHYAAASLKQLAGVVGAVAIFAFSAALRCGLIEAIVLALLAVVPRRFSAALRCGLIEARRRRRYAERLYPGFSAALRCGLIEASRGALRCRVFCRVFRSITLRPH